MTTFEPRTPAPGWALRWTSQASELMLRRLPLLLLGTVLFNLYVVPMIAVVGATGIRSTAMALVLVVVGRAVALLHLFWVLHVVMVADGHRPEQPLFSRDGMRMMLSFLLIEIVVMSIKLAISGVPGAEGGESGPLADPDSSGVLYMLVAVVGYVHASSMASLMSLIWVLGMFWPPVMVSMGMRLGIFYNRMHTTMMLKLGADYWRSMGIGFVFVLSLGMMPFWLSQIASMFGMAWIYVGAREIFGGIAENGKQAARSFAFGTPKPAPTS